MTERPRVGVSRCLLGAVVRYDGGHCHHDTVARLAKVVDWAPVCPEVAAGMSVPRPPIDWVGDRVLDRAAQIDHTHALEAAVSAAVTPPLDGFVLKAGSPSCGIESAAFYPHLEAPKAAKRVDGVLVRHLRARWPDLPLVDEPGLAAAPSAFLARVAERYAQRTNEAVATDWLKRARDLLAR